jgi:hypothetical protein
MKTISARDCYRTLKDCPDHERDISWLSRLPMILLSGAARAYMYAVYLAQLGKPGRAISFLTVADGLADDQERPYVSHLRSFFSSSYPEMPRRRSRLHSRQKSLPRAWPIGSSRETCLRTWRRCTGRLGTYSGRRIRKGSRKSAPDRST